jgi:uncharacterized protein (TIGR02145 family)
MKSIYIKAAIVFLSSFGLNAQTIMNIHKNNSTVLQIPINTIDSITYNSGIVTTPGAGVTYNGYTYSSIVLGNGQEWMAENLRTTSYSNGDPIPNVIDATQWGNLTSGAYAYYNNDSQYETPYGNLYNWYTVNDSRNLCPTGWHVPSDTEWSVLTDYLGGETIAGGKMKSLSTQYWASPNANATNEINFSGLPGGNRTDFGFNYIGYYGYWWSSTEYTSGVSWFRQLSYNDVNVGRNAQYKDHGISVRCLKD